MSKILITGADSFVGKNFRKCSQFKDVDEISLLDNKPEQIDFGKYDVVLHLAAIVHQSKKIPESEYFKINRDLCLKVARNAKTAGIRQFVFLSTLKVYGNTVPGRSLRNETSECMPVDSYGKSKFEAETGLRQLEDSIFTVSIIRTPLIYGEGVKANMMKLVKLVDFLPLLPFGRINNKRDFTYSENLVGYIDRIIEKKCSGIFIAKDEFAISTTELVSILAKFMRRKVFLFHLPDFLGRTISRIFPELFERLFGSLEFDNSRTVKELNFKPPVSTEEGLKRMIENYLSEK
jgi:nucleoside-diphosphate-sugar epimerase